MITAAVLLAAQLSQIDALFSSDKDGPGCSVGVFRDGTVVFEGEYGFSDVENRVPLRPESAFDVGSIAKQFTAMSILLLQKEGKLSIDDDVHEYLPELPAYGARLTLRHLLTHTSGIRDYEQLLLVAGWRYGYDAIMNSDALRVIVAQRRLNFTPGSEFLYSNSGYTLLAEIVKRLSGKPFAVFLRTRIFDPLGMNHTFLMTDWDTFIPNRTQGYVDPKTRVFWPYFAIGDGNIVTTIGDLAKWDANFDQPIVGDAEIVRAMTTGATLRDGTRIAYGFGLYDATYRGERVLEHDGGTPGFEADMLRFPNRHTTIAVLCNSRSQKPDVDTLARRIADLVVFDSPNRAVPAPSIGVAGESFRRFAGVYWSDTDGTSRTFAFREGKFVRVKGDQTIEDLQALDERTVRIGMWQRYRFEDNGTFTSEREGDSIMPIGSVTRARYVRKPPPDANPQSFIGTYCSDELHTKWTFVSRRKELVLLRDRHEDEALTQIFRGAFRENDVNVLFNPDGFTAVNGTLRTVEFHRCR